MMESCLKISLEAFDPIDIVGTGGDGKNTFNISTLSALIIAGAGIKVAKHGNYAATSVSGSSNVLEYLGYRFSAAENVLKRQLEKANICFLHAPLFHPAMKRVGSIRKEIGQRTFFNLLGPVLHPAAPKKQVLGVRHLEDARMYTYLLQNLPVDFMILHTLDGYDEISLTAAFKIITSTQETIYHPEQLGFKTVLPENIEAGNSIASAASVLLKILKGEGHPEQQDVAIVNSGFAIHCARPEVALEDCFAMAKESLVSKKAFQVLKKITQSL